MTKQTVGVSSLLRAILTLVLLALAAVPAVARAEDPPLLEKRVTDLAGVLDGDVVTRIKTAVDRLESERRIQLFVLFVRSSDGTPIADYADDVARLSSLGGNDALLVGAIDDRSDSLWGGSALGQATDTELDAILAERVEPALAGRDYGGAVAGAAEGLTAATAGAATTPTSTATVAATPAAGDGGGGGGIPILVVLAVIVVGSLLIFGTMRLMKGRAAEGGAAGSGGQGGAVSERANALLLQADDELADAEQEAGFAEAEFSETEVKPFRDAVAAAKDELKAAFLLRQQLDDATPEDAKAERSMQQEIVTRCERALALVGGQRQRFEGIRDLEKRAPEVLEGLASQVTVVEGRLDGAAQTMSRLQRYAEASWEPVRGNFDEARGQLTVARGYLEAGQKALTAEDRAAAAMSARRIEEALSDAKALLDAIENQEKALAESKETFEKEMIAASADVTQARVALKSGRISGFEVQVAQAEAKLQEAQRAGAAEKPDYSAAYELAAEANAAADAVLAAVQETGERLGRVRAMMDGSMRQAGAQYRQAFDYIQGRRLAVGPRARTRLAGADRRLQQAMSLSAQDPAGAANQAREAQRLAREAYVLAREDLERGGPRRGGGPGPRAGGGSFGDKSGRSRGGRW